MRNQDIKIDKRRRKQIEDIVKRIRWETGATAEDVNRLYQNILELLNNGRSPVEVAELIKHKINEGEEGRQ